MTKCDCSNCEDYRRWNRSQNSIADKQRRKEIKMSRLTQEVKELFDDQDIPWEKILRELATAFTPDITVHEIAKLYTDNRLPSKEVNGKSYVAGYRGTNIVSTGLHVATLVDIKQSGSNAKLMFAVQNNKYLFQTLDTFRVEDIVGLTKLLGETFNIVVAHEKIENTGDVHAVVVKSDKV